MKKYIAITMMFLIAATLLIPVAAAPTVVSKDLKMVLELPSDFSSATPVEFEDYESADGETSSNAAGFGYVFLKKKVDNPYATVKFEVPEDAVYDFCIALMASSSSSTTIPRTGLLQIDDSEKVYIKSVHEGRNQIPEYFVGMSVHLTKGQHEFTIYLADDFDDTTVKSLFFDKFYFVKSNVELPTTTVKPSTDGSAATSAPQTLDPVTITVALAAFSAATAALIKKRK